MSLLRASHDYQSGMAKPYYKLRTSLFGHTSDVRAVATFADGTIVSTSRDETARIWKSCGYLTYSRIVLKLKKKFFYLFYIYKLYILYDYKSDIIIL